MNAAHPMNPPPSTTRPSGVRSLSTVRSQAALVRALLDEIERLAPLGADSTVDEQFIEELARLGCQCLEIATASTAGHQKAHGSGT